jgi:hypothetical protein
MQVNDRVREGLAMPSYDNKGSRFEDGVLQ